MLWSRPGPAAVTFCLRERRRKEAVTQQRSHVTDPSVTCASVTHFLLSTVIFVRRQTMGLLLERSAFARVHSCAHFVVADINMRKCFILRKKSCGQTYISLQVGTAVFSFAFFLSYTHLHSVTITVTYAELLRRNITLFPESF